MPARHFLLTLAAAFVLSGCNGGNLDDDILIGGAGGSDGFEVGGGDADGGGLVIGGEEDGFIADDEGIDLLPDAGDEGVDFIPGEDDAEFDLPAEEDGIVLDGDDDGPLGRLDLAVTDAPIDDALGVFVTFTGVLLQHSDGRRLLIEFDTPRPLNLLLLTEGETALLVDDRLVPAGRYQSLRLLMEPGADAFVDTAVGRFPLGLAGGIDDGLQFNGDFIVPPDGEANLIVDVDLRRGLVRSPREDSFLLRPALRLVDRNTFGSITGTVSPALINDARCRSPGFGSERGNVVSVFSGFDVTPDDIDGDIGDPITSADVGLDPITGDRAFLLSFLPPGAYTLAFTCQGALDDPLTDNQLFFTDTRNITVNTGRTASVDF